MNSKPSPNAAWMHFFLVIFGEGIGSWLSDPPIIMFFFVKNGGVSPMGSLPV